MTIDGVIFQEEEERKVAEEEEMRRKKKEREEELTRQRDLEIQVQLDPLLDVNVCYHGRF